MNQIEAEIHAIQNTINYYKKQQEKTTEKINQLEKELQKRLEQVEK